MAGALLIATALVGAVAYTTNGFRFAKTLDSLVHRGPTQAVSHVPTPTPNPTCYIHCLTGNNSSPS